MVSFYFYSQENNYYSILAGRRNPKTHLFLTDHKQIHTDSVMPFEILNKTICKIKTPRIPYSNRQNKKLCKNMRKNMTKAKY